MGTKKKMDKQFSDMQKEYSGLDLSKKYKVVPVKQGTKLADKINEAVTATLQFKKDADGVSAGGKKVGKGKYKFTFKSDTEMMQFMDKHSSKMLEGVETEIAREKESIARSNEKIKGLQDKEDRKKSIGDNK
jgi:hypothetical protein